MSNDEQDERDQQQQRHVKKVPVLSKIISQINLLLWKRRVEIFNQKWEAPKYLGIPGLFFVLMILLYEVFVNNYSGDIEEYFVPIAFWMFIQKNVVNIMFEKSTRLQESMRMMGLSDAAYWVSYFISDGLVLGFIVSMFCTILSTPGLFNEGNFGSIFAMLFLFCIASVPFGFFLCSFFDTPQTAGQATLGILLGLFVIYIALDLSSASIELQTFFSLIPPLALQIGCSTFKNSYEGLSLASICGLLFADSIIYSILAWYFSQVWPSKIGLPKSPLFFLQPSYWISPSRYDPKSIRPADIETVLPIQLNQEESNKTVPNEPVNSSIFGQPTVSIRGLRKTFDNQIAVNEIHFDMYPNQIFALLGHNGAGKTTTINMLTGLLPPDLFSTGDATIYGNSVLYEMDEIRHSMGVCPQHDVLFENLSVADHILFFSQLKGSTYHKAKEEARNLSYQFHLEERLDHTGSELSGGQKRKLSVAIAVCGGSKFIVLDEPSAGMDPLARREMWDLLASLRNGRTMLLTTHYMDEADILGDRVAIMSLGEIQCIGSTQFLKTTYGAGYNLIFDKLQTATKNQIHELTQFIQSFIAGAIFVPSQDSADVQLQYTLPFDSIGKFGQFFTNLEENLTQFCVSKYGVTITSLEDVFLKVGEDHSVKPHAVEGTGIGSSRAYSVNFFSQIVGICKRKLNNARNDFVTIPLVLLPISAIIVAAVLYQKEIVSGNILINDLLVSAIYMAGYFGAPGLIAEFLVRERVDKLRNVLTVMGCDFRAYWIGTLLADFILMSIPMCVLFMTWFVTPLEEFFERKSGLSFCLIVFFHIYMISFSYIFSYSFLSPKSCVAILPLIVIVLLILPVIVLLLMILIFDSGLHLFRLSSQAQLGILLWGLMLFSPHGALFVGLLDIIADFSQFIKGYPPIEATLSLMLVQSVIYLGLSYLIDRSSVMNIDSLTDPTFDENCLNTLDEDVKQERTETLSELARDSPLRIERLRKVYPPKRHGGKSVVATQDICFNVQKGEIFGLLGANGAGKTTTLSMLTRHAIPTSGNAFIANHSILNDFKMGSTHLGVVTQNNSLWDLLSVQDHLKLFARLRGVPEDIVYRVVESTIDQLELRPHRHKLAGRLSGGMKRKLCVAIALIGDPEVVLLDEPSAGLDPVSRRNLWNVILRTMSHRAVVLTTHSMEEAEALCKRIGIMVLGQVRALGTKQHLKTKFGSGYELSIKYQTTILVDQTKKDGQIQNQQSIVNRADDIVSFMNTLFPTSKFLSDNGGLMTFTVPSVDMKMGLAFSEIETHKARLFIEDYSISQSTLEQVFIRTVQTHTPQHQLPREFLLSSTNSKQRVDDMLGPNEQKPLTPGDEADEVIGVYRDALNSCGCTVKFTKYSSMITCFLFLLFFILSIAVGVSALLVLAIIALITFCICCMLCSCPCCKPPKDEE